MVLFYIPKLVLLQFWVNVYIISIKWICCYCCLWSKAKDPVITWVVLVVALLFYFYFHLCIIKLQPPCYPTTKLFLSFPLSLTLSLLPVSLSLPPPMSTYLCQSTYLPGSSYLLSTSLPMYTYIYQSLYISRYSPQTQEPETIIFDFNWIEKMSGF